MGVITCLDERFYDPMNLPGEERKDIEGYEGCYRISNWGRVYSYYRRGLLLKIRLDHHGYCIVKPSKEGNQKTTFVHKLVMLAFKPHGRKRTINHIDGNPVNNHFQNLEWATYSENHRHSFDKLGRKSGTYGYKGKLSKSSKDVFQYTIDHKFIRHFYGACEAERITGFSQYGIRNCCAGRSKSACGYFRSYKKLDGDAAQKD